jgi:ectoine hydroxylase-related dioxygenase (phytanoyl-CoA dioxygenase family)
LIKILFLREVNQSDLLIIGTMLKMGIGSAEMTKTAVPPETIAAFERDGAVALKGYFADWVEVLRAGIARNMAEPSADVKIYKGRAGGGRFFGDYCNWDRIPEYKDFIFNSPAAEIGRQLMGTKTARLFHEHVLVKEASAGVATPWHQDQPYYCVDGNDTVSIWIPLDHLPRDRTLEFVGGSHKWGKYFRPERFDKTPLNENDGLEEVPDINGNRDSFNVIGWALEPGDAVAFNYKTLHGAPANNSASEQRRAFSLRLLGDDARFARREGVKTSPPFRGVTLAHGAVMNSPEFPVLIS